VRATLHDELMRDAGFESGDYLEVARRREERRARLRHDLLRTTTVVGLIGAVAGGVVVIVDGAGKTARAPWALYLVLAVLGVTGGLANALQRRMTRREDVPRRPGLWKRITRPWRESQF
jgi:hypothetical protein